MEKAREFQKNTYFCFVDYLKGFDCVDHRKLWKIPKGLGIPDHITCLLREPSMWVKKQQLEPNTERLTVSKLGKEHTRLSIVTLLYLAYMQSISCEMPG